MQVITLILTAIIAIYITHVFDTKYEMYLTESKCISYYINMGIERNQIQTNKGKCYVKSTTSSNRR